MDWTGTRPRPRRRRYTSTTCTCDVTSSSTTSTTHTPTRAATVLSGTTWTTSRAGAGGWGGNASRSDTQPPSSPRSTGLVPTPYGSRHGTTREGGAGVLFVRHDRLDRRFRFEWLVQKLLRGP